MPDKCEAPLDGGASRNSCGGCFRDPVTPPAYDEQALALHVRLFLPDAQGEDLEHRIAMLKARDWAAALRGRTISPRTFNLACDAHEVAGDFVFAPKGTPERTAFAAKLARHLVVAAMIAQQIDDGQVGS